jgi:hypothetical protein
VRARCASYALVGNDGALPVRVRIAHLARTAGCRCLELAVDTLRTRTSSKGVAYSLAVGAGSGAAPRPALAAGAAGRSIVIPRAGATGSVVVVDVVVRRIVVRRIVVADVVVWDIVVLDVVIQNIVVADVIVRRVVVRDVIVRIVVHDHVVVCDHVVIHIVVAGRVVIDRVVVDAHIVVARIPRVPRRGRRGTGVILRVVRRRARPLCSRDALFDVEQRVARPSAAQGETKRDEPRSIARHPWSDPLAHFYYVAARISKTHC